METNLVNTPKPKGTILDRKVSTARKEYQCHICENPIAPKTQYVILCISNWPDSNNIFLKYHLGCEPKE